MRIPSNSSPKRAIFLIPKEFATAFNKQSTKLNGRFSAQREQKIVQALSILVFVLINGWVYAWSV
ncbi:MAG: hypothetical protein ACFFAE_18395 [Candidatus Hodarchaeota archaeon]